MDYEPGRDARSARTRLRLAFLAATCASVLGACGGGGDAGSSAPPGAPATQGDIVVGDYVVYDNERITTAPGGIPSVRFTTAMAYYQVGNGLLRRVVTNSTTGATYQTFNTAAAFLSIEPSLGGTALCTYTPALQSSPPYPRSVGQTWSVTSGSTCDASSSSTQSGQVVAREALVTPAGTFDTFRATRQATTSASGGNTAQTLTCWYDVVRGTLLRCDFTTSNTPPGSSTPSSVNTQTQVVIGLGGPSRTPRGDVLARFAGNWTVQYVGGATGSCNPLSVSAAGAVTGTCTTSGVGSFSVTGTVAANGAVTISQAGGATLTGTLDTPYSGNGTWAQGVATGTWTATHN